MKTETFQIIQSAIIHKLTKTQGDKQIVVDERNALLAITPALQKLVDTVHDYYAKRVGKSYGAFRDDVVNNPAQTFIRRLVDDGQPAFVDISKSLLSILADRAKKETFSTGGYVLMADIVNGATRWFLVAVLTDTAGAAINDDLEVVEATHIDLSAMRFAGRVNITDWDSGAERYISFLRGKKSEVSEYFQEFFGCSTLVKGSLETQRMVGVVKKFAVDQGLDDIRREKLLADVDSFSRKCIKDQRPLELESLSNYAWPDAPELLQTAFAESDPAISDGFEPDGRSLNSLKKFRAKTATWAIEFDRGAMADHTIQFDRQKRELRITNIPDTIAAELIAEFSNDNA